MSRAVAGVTLNTVLALATTVTWVPWQEGRWADPPWTAQQIADHKQWWRDSTAEAVAERELTPADRDQFLSRSLKQVDDYDGRVTETGWRYGFVWDGMEVDSAPNPSVRSSRDHYGERVLWKWVFVAQALVLLLGGGLLTFVVRRERRRKVGG